MDKIQKYGLLMLMSLLTAVCAFAAPSFTASAPAKVQMGQQFRLTYTFEDGDPKDFRLPELSDFDILMGPSTSTSISIINGQTSRSFSYTYVLMPKQEGTFTIAPATAQVKKAEVQSNSLTVTVLPKDKNTQVGQSSQASSSQGATSVQSLTEENLFIRVIPSKTHVMEQEGLTLTYKLYSRVDVSGFENAKFPEYKGFISQEVELPQNQQWDMENYNGLNYRTAVLRQTVLYPQQSGQLDIESGSFDLIVRVRNNNPRSRSFFDDFFDTYQDVRKTLTTKPLKITVDPFPFGKPAHFSPFAGSLKLSSSISTTSVTADEAVTLKLVLTGSGNMKMLKTPDVKFPADFDIYDPKVTNSFKNTAKGVTGSKTIEYLVIPRYAGSFEIPSVEVSYFDLATKSYKTLVSDSYTLEVAKGSQSDPTVVSNAYVAKENVRFLGQDIRYLKTDLKLKPHAGLIYGQSWFVWAFVLPFAIFVIVLLICRKQAKANADVAAVRTRKASKVAVRRLKKAASFLKAGDRSQFYEEVLKALWGYTSDKLNIPLSKLSKEHMDEQLEQSHVSETIRKEYMEILETCEFEQYAPSSGAQGMDELYAKTLKVIDKMESTIKTLVCLVLLGGFALMSTPVLAAEAQDSLILCASQAYAAGEYAQAADCYEQLKAYGESPQLYYNLGNAYFKSNEIASAILNYERALRLAPRDEDIRFNLEMSQAYVVDQIEPLGEFMLARWYRNFGKLLSSNLWSLLSLAFFAVFIACLCGFFFSRRGGLKKLSFWMALISIVITIFTLSYASRSYDALVHPDEAIVFAPTVTVKSSPDQSGTDIFLLHEGTKVRIKSTLGAWSEIELADGSVGWMETEQIVII